MKTIFHLTITLMIVFSVALPLRAQEKSASKAANELLRVEAEWTQAFMKNNAAAIERFIADDWVIVDADGGVIDKAKFLAAIKSGALTHDTIKLDEPNVRIYGDTAIVTGRATSSGKYMATPFTTHERSTDVFVKRDGRWRCFFTQLTRLSEKKD
jgi:ketosteroid isomerase-like protein